ncbi:MAG TPA: DsbA family protein, partial [Azospirillaceae bacterium]|nr:DsbA family protein [Azospirillaceae bacterium]
PILGPASVTAARAALAAQGQGKYTDLHKALMAHKGALDSETIFRLAKSAGLNVDQLKKDMDAPAIHKALQANVQLADSLGIRGTPGFVIGDELIPGAIRLDDMKRRVVAARGR